MQANNNQNPNQAQITFENEVPTLDPAVVSLSMGNRDNPPEEPLLLSLQDGFGYNVAAANGRTLSGFHLVRKVCTSSLNQTSRFIFNTAGLVEFMLGVAWNVSFLMDSWLILYHHRLCSDTLAPTLTYAALKIMTKRASIDIHVSPLVPPDIEIYKRTSQLRLHPGFNHCATLQWHLATTSGLGRHVCYVTEVLSSSLANLRPRGQNRFTLPIAKRIIKQVLLALQCLHDKMWYTHTGEFDLCPFASVPNLIKCLHKMLKRRKSLLQFLSPRILGSKNIAKQTHRLIRCMALLSICNRYLNRSFSQFRSRCHISGSGVLLKTLRSSFQVSADVCASRFSISCINEHQPCPSPYAKEMISLPQGIMPNRLPSALLRLLSGIHGQMPSTSGQLAL